MQASGDKISRPTVCLTMSEGRRSFMRGKLHAESWGAVIDRLQTGDWLCWRDGVCAFEKIFAGD